MPFNEDTSVIPEICMHAHTLSDLLLRQTRAALWGSPFPCSTNSLSFWVSKKLPSTQCKLWLRSCQPADEPCMFIHRGFVIRGELWHLQGCLCLHVSGWSDEAAKPLLKKCPREEWTEITQVFPQEFKPDFFIARNSWHWLILVFPYDLTLSKPSRIRGWILFFIYRYLLKFSKYYKMQKKRKRKIQIKK